MITLICRAAARRLAGYRCGRHRYPPSNRAGRRLPPRSSARTVITVAWTLPELPPAVYLSPPRIRPELARA